MQNPHVTTVTVSGPEAEILVDNGLCMAAILGIQDGCRVFVGSCSYNATSVMVSGVEADILADLCR